MLATYAFWKDFAGPLATVLASVVAVVVTVHLGGAQANIAREQARIAQQQAELARIRLNHDLYDRRFAIYTAACKLFQDILTKLDATDADIIDFIRATATARFLVGSEISFYFDEIRKNARRIQRINRRLNQERHDEDFSKLNDELMGLSDWFEAQFEVVAIKFEPFLSLKSA